MFIGNVLLLIINLPLIGLWVRLLRIPYRFLFMIILVVCAIGVYSVKNSAFDVYMTLGFGLLGYLLRKLECEPAPLLMGFVLGPALEENFRRALIVADGNVAVFVQRPISLGLLLIALALLVSVALPTIRTRREKVFQE
jgi:putative tricarboxylic transport membrane protein